MKLSLSFMKFSIILINKTPISIAIENENIEIVKLLLECNNFNINLPNVNLIKFIKFLINTFI